MAAKFELIEHEKLHRVKDRSQQLGEFLEWLRDHGYEICENTGRKYVQYEPVRKNVTQWLAEFFEIDLAKLEEEKEVMLAELRKH